MHNPIFALLMVLVVAAATIGALATKLKPRDGLLAKPWPLEAKRQQPSANARCTNDSCNRCRTI